METKRMRRCIPLKVAAHILMAIATAALVVCGVLFLMFVTSGIGNASGITKNGVEYFSSTSFVSEYGKTIDNLLSAMDSMGESGSGYPLEAFINNRVNFKFAVYDRQGKLLESSTGWSDDQFLNEEKKYYYIVDLNGLEIFKDVNPIRTVRFANAYSEGYGDDAGNFETIEGKIVYSSNFTKYTSFYMGAESDYANKIGYICTYVPENLQPGDNFYDGYRYFKIWSESGRWGIAGIGISLLCIIICFTYLMVSAGYGHKQETVCLNRYDKIYTEIAAVLTFGVPVFLSALAFEGIDLYNAVSVVGSLVFLVPAYGFFVSGLLSFARRFKAGAVIRGSVTYKIGKGICDVIANGIIKNNIVRKYVVVIFAMGLGDLILMAIAANSYSMAMWTIVFAIYAYEFVYIGRRLLQVESIKKGAQAIAAGNLEYKIDTTHMKGILKGFAEDINNIGGGLNAAVDERTKSERMKADLITNVSHDIKTPLTSIINYVDLLKRENITDQPMKEYIEVLDQKSKRLKDLTEDLVEASRASSGNIVLEKNCINFVELVAQVAGTYQEKYETKNLQIIFNSEADEMMIMADGRRLYRVLDNLFNNAFKYSIEHSRVYVDMYSGIDKACFVMKNISKAPLNISGDDLMQRFVRGDSSRTTEGSGLGLSIARSLVELHGGKFDIYLDGDLFKAMITLDLTKDGN